VSVAVPDFMGQIVATMTQLARQSTHINQRSGVSVRLSVANYETLVANATRRTLRAGESLVAPRVSDLDSLTSSTVGKVEFETLEDGREGEILQHLVRSAVLTVFKQLVPPETHRAVVEAFEGGVTVKAGEDVSSAEYLALLQQMPALQVPVRALLEDESDKESPAVVASAIELVLEGLHLSKRLNKEATGGRAQYRSRA
jgi:magnesium chelatase subunit I